MNTNNSKNVSIRNFVLLLFALSVPFLVIGAIYDVQLFINGHPAGICLREPSGKCGRRPLIFRCTLGPGSAAVVK